MKKKVNGMRAKDQQGSIIIFVALAIIMFLAFAALAVDWGYKMVTRNELQNISDGASLAATRYIGYTYKNLNLTYEQQQSYVFDSTTIVSIAQEIALQNQAAKKNIVINDSDVFIGKWDAGAKSLYDIGNMNQPDAVRVIARRDDVANSPITTFFAKTFGKDTVDVTAYATAALTGQSTAESGGLPVPVGISARWFEQPDFCDQPIKFYPTNTPEGCAGWTTYTDDFYDKRPPNMDKLRDIIDALGSGLKSPAAKAGETSFEFVGGNLADALKNFKALFDKMRVLNDGILDADQNSATWTTAVVVYSYEGLSDPCANPNKPARILGFSTVTITNVIAPPDGQLVEAIVKCDFVDTGRGGGGEYGTKGDIPGLVEPFK